MQVSGVENGAGRCTHEPWVWTLCGIVGGGREHIAVVIVEVVGVAGQTESSLVVVVHNRVQVSGIVIGTGQNTYGPW